MISQFNCEHYFDSKTEKWDEINDYMKKNGWVFLNWWQRIKNVLKENKTYVLKCYFSNSKKEIQNLVSLSSGACIIV